MRKLGVLTLLTALPFAVVATSRSVDFGSEDDSDTVSVRADVVAVGIPGAGAIAQVGTFHKGGPFHENPSFVPFTQPGQVLDRTRLFVASTSNFGIGCATCHRPTMFGPGNSRPNPTTIRPYTDLLLHDMGSGLADGFLQGSATGSEFRTAPLWRVSDRQHFLHDGRAASITDAINAHGGQAAGAADRFRALSATDRQALLAFLSCI